MRYLQAYDLCNFKRFESNMPWLWDRTIFLAKHGSHAYGTSLPTSDLDVRGIAIPPKEYMLGYLHHFEQAEGKADPDLVIYGLQKFFSLAAQCNPNIIEILWIDENDWLKTTPSWDLLHEHRDMFLSQKAKHTFSGYAMSQLKRIKTHHKWLMDPPKKKPERSDFDLPEMTVIPKDQLAAVQAMVQKKVDSWELDLDALEPSKRIYIMNQLNSCLCELYGDDIIKSKEGIAARLIGIDDNMISILYKERDYANAKHEWDNYQNWKTTRNETRAKLEAAWGYDTKHAMHLVRLMRMCREIITEGKVIVKRPDAGELLAIRNGSWKYDDLLAWAAKEDEELSKAMATSPLPKKPNAEKIDALCIEIVERSL